MLICFVGDYGTYVIIEYSLHGQYCSGDGLELPLATLSSWPCTLVFHPAESSHLLPRGTPQRPLLPLSALNLLLIPRSE